MNKLFPFFLVCSLIFSCLSTKAQSVNLKWAKGIIGNSFGFAKSMTLDTLGNIYLAGDFVDSVDFDPGPGIFPLEPGNNQDVYLVKLDNFGNFIWAKTFGGLPADDVFSITIDSDQNILLTGEYEGTADFDPGPGIAQHTSPSVSSLYVLKLDSDGNYIWSKTMEGTWDSRGYGIATDESNNVYVTGEFGGTTDFDPGPGTLSLTNSPGGSVDYFVLKLDASGNLIWAFSGGDTGGEVALSIAVDSQENAYVTGFFGLTVDFDPGPGVVERNAVGDVDIFISKFSPTGDLVWVSTFGGKRGEVGNVIALDELNNIYVGGYFRDTIEFEPNLSFVSDFSQQSGYVLKLNNAGELMWAQAMIGPSRSSYQDLKIGRWGDVYATGHFWGPQTFSSGTTGNSISSAGNRDIFVQKLDSAGNFIWAETMGGPDRDEGQTIAVDNNGYVYVAGEYLGIADFNPGAAVTNLPYTITTGRDIFVVKLRPQEVGIGEKSLQKTSFDLYPNPANENITIEWVDEVSQAQTSIFDITGKKIYSIENVSGKSINLTTTALPLGIYFVLVETKGYTKAKKFVKL